VDNRLPIVFPADFLSSSVALMNFKRLSSQRATHVAVASNAKQEIYPATL
jgi:hypothetical protein